MEALQRRTVRGRVRVRRDVMPALAAALGALASLALGLRRRTGEHVTTFGL